MTGLRFNVGELQELMIVKKIATPFQDDEIRTHYVPIGAIAGALVGDGSQQKNVDDILHYIKFNMPAEKQQTALRLGEPSALYTSNHMHDTRGQYWRHKHFPETVISTLNVHYDVVKEMVEQGIFTYQPKIEKYALMSRKEPENIKPSMTENAALRLGLAQDRIMDRPRSSTCQSR